MTCLRTNILLNVSEACLGKIAEKCKRALTYFVCLVLYTFQSVNNQENILNRNSYRNMFISNRLIYSLAYIDTEVLANYSFQPVNQCCYQFLPLGH